MLLLQLSSRRTTALVRLNRVIRSPSMKSSLRFCRTNTTKSYPISPNSGSKKPLYPERLIIYHAGTGRTVFLGCLKLTTIFICTFFCLIAAPSHFYSQEQPSWVAGAVLLSGFVPMIFVGYVTRPFVNYVHLRLPPFARASREMVARYSQKLPKDAELDITMMNFIGKPRVSRMKVSEVYPTKERFGLANYARNTDEINSTRSWWMGKVPRQFGIHGSRSKIMGGEIWNNVSKSIAKNRRI